MNELIKTIQQGLPLDTLEPYKKMANNLGVTESEILSSIQLLKDDKSIKRFGPVLHNRQVGFNQNAMTTLKVASEKINELGKKIAAFDFVTLCYEREMIPEVWEFNLYFMIHGKERAIVENQIQLVLNSIKSDLIDHEILFSSQCFKQKGATY